MATMTAVVDDADSTLVEQLVHAELGNSAYVLVDRESGFAGVIDPPRDADRFLDLARGAGWRITTALDTHVHNDFVSGGPDIRAAVDAAYVVPAGSGVAGADRELRDGDEVEIGSLRLRAVHSPGHTPEHLSYLLLGPDGAEIALLSGGALMVGTMARPDLLGPSRTFGLSRSGHATMRRLMATYGDDLLVLPTHGGGSFCGAASSDERTTTIGRERRGNPLATAPDLAHFLAVHAKQGEYPTYYHRMAAINRAGMPGLAAPSRLVERVTAEDFVTALAGGARAVDCRPHEAFDAAHIADSVSVALNGPFSPWVGWLLDIDEDIVLVAESAADAEEATRQLVRIGFTRVGRWMDLADWTRQDRPVRGVARRTMSDLAEIVLDGGAVTVVDVRQENEWAAGHLPGAVHALPPAMATLAEELDRAAPVAVHCATGHRSAIAASLLLRAGVTDVWHVTDGVDAWEQLGHPLVTAA
jgi:hydroxyacylglutathione hydrolase